VSTDLYSTVLELAGKRDSERRNAVCDGLSLVELFRHPGRRLEREALCFHYPHYYRTTTPVGAIRCGQWKLLEYFEDGRTELYNLAEDLGETHDLSAKRSDKAEELLRRLQA
jgi:arylsulfatase A